MRSTSNINDRAEVVSLDILDIAKDIAIAYIDFQARNVGSIASLEELESLVGSISASLVKDHSSNVKAILKIHNNSVGVDWALYNSGLGVK